MTHSIKQTRHFLLVNALDQLKGVCERPHHEARLLLAYATCTDAATIFTYPEEGVSHAQAEFFQQLIQRRKKHEPISKIIGSREFYGRDFIVSKNVLDPRADSETIIRACLDLAGGFSEQPPSVLDLGTGSGCLLITLMLELNASKGVGIDLSDEALVVAQENVSKFNLLRHITLRKGSWCDTLAPNDKFSLIVSNPPYIPDNTPLEPNVLDFDPHLALFSGADGMDSYRMIATQAPNFLSDDGLIVLEIGRDQEYKIQEIFEKNNMSLYKFYCDFQGIKRCLVFKKH